MSTINPGMFIKPPFGGQLSDRDLMDVPEGYARQVLNWLKREGGFAVRPGYRQVGSSLGESTRGLIQYDHHSGHKFTVIGTATKWWKWNLGTLAWNNITEGGNPLTGDDDTHQLFRVFYKSNKAYVVGVNGHADAPKKWDGEAATYSNVGGTPPKAKCLAINNNRLILGNTYTSQANAHQVDVSGFNDFETGWGTVQLVNLSDTPGHIVEMRELGNLVTAIYKSDAVYVAIAQDALAPYSFELRAPYVQGPVSPRCVVSLPAAHVFMSQSGALWQFDGIHVTELPAHLRKHIVDTADLGALSKAHGFYDAINGEVWFLYCGRSSSEPNLGLVINLTDYSGWPIEFTNIRPVAGLGAEMEQNVMIGDMVEPLSFYTGALKTLSHLYLKSMLVDKSGVVLEEGGNTDNISGVIYFGNNYFGNNYFGSDYFGSDFIGSDESISAIPVSLETGMQSPSSMKSNFTVNDVDVLFAKTPASQEVEVLIGYSDDGSEPAYRLLGSVDIGNVGPYRLDARVTSKLFSVKLSAMATQPIKWRGMMVSGAVRGIR